MKDLIDYSRETGTGPMGKCYLFPVHYLHAIFLLFLLVMKVAIKKRKNHVTYFTIVVYKLRW